jgi:hypothetical protein
LVGLQRLCLLELLRVGVFVPELKQMSVVFSEEQNSCITEGKEFTAQGARHVVDVMMRAGDALQHIYLIYDFFLHFITL